MLEQQSAPQQPRPNFGPPQGDQRPAAEPVIFDASLFKRILGKDYDESDERVRTFTGRLITELEPNRTTEEVVAKVVKAAVETEFGQDGVKTLGLERFMKIMTEAICLNEEMLERTIALASRCLRIKLDIDRQPKQ